ncbi:unnamed protein product [Linum tenue]|uniref:Cytochrome P450 n=1 Tax=Linum tenue TaxID=586396 RepID=A0AAV0JJ19_9ROSI|nr:unnamed protein product [Linum tenue]
MDFFFFFLVNCLLCLFSFTFLGFLARKAANNQTPAAKLPPGPARLPIIGNIHNLGLNPHKSLADLAKVHGPLMSLKLGQVTTIVASSPAVAKEILQKHDKLLSDRHITLAIRHVVLALQTLDLHKFSITMLPVEPRWRNLRRVCNSYIFTSQKLDSNQGLRRDKIVELVEGVRRNACSEEKVAVDVGKVAFRATLNALSATILSMDLADEATSEAARQFKELASGMTHEAGTPNLGDFFPFLAKFDLQGIQRRIRVHMEKALNLFEWLIDQRLRERKSESYVSANDVLDTLLAINDDAENREEVHMDLQRIKYLFLDLFVAGTDTTATTLEWAMAELLRNPKALTKLKEELDQTIGKENHLNESDIPRLPYLQAVIKEIFRLHPPLPLLLPHKAGVDVEIDGFTVPKGAQILVNLWAIGRDPMIWDDPNSFTPERFLGSEVDARGNHFELITFGAGRRICPGMSLAYRMLHMMLGSLVHWFDWKLPSGVKPEQLNMKEKFGVTLQKAKPLLAIPTLR